MNCVECSGTIVSRPIGDLFVVDEINFKLNLAFLEDWNRPEHSGLAQKRVAHRCAGKR